MFKVIRSNTEIAITPSQIVQLRSNFGTEFHHIVDNTLQMFKVKGEGHGVKGQGHSVK